MRSSIFLRCVITYASGVHYFFKICAFMLLKTTELHITIFFLIVMSHYLNRIWGYSKEQTDALYYCPIESTSCLNFLFCENLTLKVNPPPPVVVQEILIDALA